MGGPKVYKLGNWDNMRNDLFNQFHGRRVLLTGHTGFKGSWLTLWLHELGAEVVGFAQEPPTNPSHFNVANVADKMEASIISDVRDEAHLTQVIADTRPELVMHLAAQSVVRTGYDEPLETFSTNVMGTANVLDAVRRTTRGSSKKQCAVLVVTSDKCYENVEQTWGYRECDPMGDHDPYGGSKGAAELVVRTYRHSYFPIDRLDQHGVWLASARAGNVIGGGDWTANALIVDTVKAITQQIPIQIRSPQAVRPWQHVLQCLSGYLTISAQLLEAKNPSICSGWNIGPQPGNELTVQKVVEQFIDFWGAGQWDDISDPNQPREAEILRLSIDKALTHLGWQPGWNVDTTLEKTAEWYQRYTQTPDAMQQVSLDHIAQYQQTIEELSKQAHAKPRVSIARH